MKTKRSKRWTGLMACLMFIMELAAAGRAPAGDGGLRPLSSVAVPLPANLGDFVVDRDAAVRLGKALFWDQQAGGDGVQACATCHFQAGSDVRFINAVNPRGAGQFTGVFPGDTLTSADFPVTNGDVVGSQGVVEGNFIGVSGGPVDTHTLAASSFYASPPGSGNLQRQVTARNAPSVIGAIYYYRNFWDGRANNSFNGADHFGPANNSAFVYKIVSGEPLWVAISFSPASAASQAVGAPNNPVEMSFAGRTFALLANKLLQLRPLAQQTVDPTDSVLGQLANPGGGLDTTYAAMIQAAFDPKWWDFTGTLADGFSVMELNFSLYWGISIMLYESTLIPDQTPLDKYLSGNVRALDSRQRLGMNVFNGKGRCNKCHSGAELTEAAVSQAQKPTDGFVNTALRPASEDGGDVLQPGLGMFKTPGLRNVELNGPYFHNGGMSTLRQVVEFYNRGGDFPVKGITDGEIRQLKLKESEKAALVDFMTAMTDERVRWERKPFDHPSLSLPNGTDLPAVGAAGRAVQQGPVRSFLDLDPRQK